MKKCASFFILWIGISAMICEAQNWSWAKAGRGSDNEEAYRITSDLNGNVYVTGKFASDTIVFDSDTLFDGDAADIFLVKYDPEGNLIWAKSHKGYGIDDVRGLVTDSMGNVYLTGFYFSSGLTFDNYTLGREGISDMFLVKYDPSGNVIWAKRAGGEDEDSGRSMTIDADGNLIVAGMFLSDTIRFDNQFVVKSTSGYNMFIVKYDSSGNVIWSKEKRGLRVQDPRGIVADKDGNIYVAGMSNDDISIIKYDKNGIEQWSKATGGHGVNNTYDMAEGIGIDNEGNIYVAGNYTYDSVAFGNYVFHNPNNSNNIFIVKYNSAGDVLWARAIDDDNNYELNTSIAVNQYGEVYITGLFSGDSIHFGNDISLSPHSGFIARYDSDGNALWARELQGRCLSVHADNNRSVYVTGSYNEADAVFGSIVLTNQGSMDVYAAKMGDITGLSPNEIMQEEITLYPNPNNGIFKLNFNLKQRNPISIEIINTSGQIVSLFEYAVPAQFEINLEKFPKGLYLVKVVEESRVISLKKVIVL